MSGIDEVKNILFDLPNIRTELDELKSQLQLVNSDKSNLQELKEIKELLSAVPSLKAEIALLKEDLKEVANAKPDLSGIDEVKAAVSELASAKPDLSPLEDIKSTLDELPAIKAEIAAFREDLSKFQEMDSNIKALSGIQTKLVDVLDEIKNNLSCLSSLNEQMAGLATKSDLGNLDARTAPADSLIEAMGDRLVEFSNKSTVLDARMAEMKSRLDNISEKIDGAVAAPPVPAVVGSDASPFDNQKLEDINAKLEAVNGSFSGIDSKLEAVKESFAALDSKLQILEGKLSANTAADNADSTHTDERFASIDSKLEALESSFVDVDTRLEGIDNRINANDAADNSASESNDERFAEMNEKFDSVNGRFLDVINKIEALDDKLTKSVPVVEETKEIKTVWGDSKDKILAVDLPDFPEDSDPISTAVDAEIVLDEPKAEATERKDTNFTRKRKALSDALDTRKDE